MISAACTSVEVDVVAIALSSLHITAESTIVVCVLLLLLSRVRESCLAITVCGEVVVVCIISSI